MKIQECKILIVEDNPIIAADLESFFLSSDVAVSGIAHSASQAQDILASREVNFAILDIHLGTGGSGLDIAEVIHDKYHIPYIFLSSFDDEDTMEKAQKHGPYGYLVKPFQERTIVTTIKTALANFTRKNIIYGFNEEVFTKKAITPLTNQELVIIEKLVGSKSYRQIGEELFVSINTVKFHTKNIYSKLEVSGRLELAQLV